jgi:hypothetical protein
LGFVVIHRFADRGYTHESSGSTLIACFKGTDRHEDLRRLAVRQRGVIHRDQFRALDVSRNYVTNQIDARRWNAIGKNVVLL